MDLFFRVAQKVRFLFYIFFLSIIPFIPQLKHRKKHRLKTDETFIFYLGMVQNVDFLIVLKKYIYFCNIDDNSTSIYISPKKNHIQRES